MRKDDDDKLRQNVNKGAQQTSNKFRDYISDYDYFKTNEGQTRYMLYVATKALKPSAYEASKDLKKVKKVEQISPELNHTNYFTNY